MGFSDSNTVKGCQPTNRCGTKLVGLPGVKYEISCGSSLVGILVAVVVAVVALLLVCGYIVKKKKKHSKSDHTNDDTIETLNVYEENINVDGLEP